MSALKDACDAALDNPAFQPRDGETFCNLAAASIAQALGCGELQGLMADEIYAKMANNAAGHWTKLDGSSASQKAIAGGLVIAAMSSGMLSEAHGHVAVLYPQSAEFSGSLNRYVPCVANIGKTVGVMKSSEAFPVSVGEADYFAWS
jgi:hypothetical protein